MQPLVTPRGLKIRVSKDAAQPLLNHLDKAIDVDNDIFLEVEMWTHFPDGVAILGGLIAATVFHSWYEVIGFSVAAYALAFLAHNIFYSRALSVVIGLFVGAPLAGIILGLVVTFFWLRNDSTSTLVAVWAVILGGAFGLLEVIGLFLTPITSVLKTLRGRPWGAPELAFNARVRWYMNQFGIPSSAAPWLGSTFGGQEQKEDPSKRA